LPVGDLLRQVQARLLQLSPFQFTPLMEIQRLSEVPWRHRLFDSLLVFQNYQVDDSARKLGSAIEIADFVGPIHTSYPITLLAEPGQPLRITLIYDRHSVAGATVARWTRDLTTLFERLPEALAWRVADLQALLSEPVSAAPMRKQRFRVESHAFVPPQTDMERTVSAVWQQMFGLDRVSIEENFFDLGGHSMLLVQMHIRLRETLKSDFPVVTLFQYPTIRSLARYLSDPIPAAPTGQQWRERAQRQQKALAQLKRTLKKRQS